MNEKHQWETDQIKKDNEDQNKIINDHEIRIRDVEKYRVKSTELFKTVFKRLEKLESTSVWISRSFIGIIFTGILGALSAFIKWLVNVLSNGGMP